MERIRITDTRWRELSESPLFDLAKVQTALARRSQAVLSLHYSEPVLTCVLLWRGECRVASVSLAPALRKDLSDYADNLSREQPNIFQHDLSAEFGTQASDLIPRELLSLALNAQSLVIVPHGLLHLLPWAALIYEGKRLFEELPVGIFPNLALLAGDAEPAPARSVSILGVSKYPDLGGLADLPSVEQELADIGRLYREAGLPVDGPYLDADATAAAYRSLTRGLSGPGHLLHLSCHGTIVPREPMNSGLLLADSKLDAAEVAGHRLPFDEVVLSACSTGWRPTQVEDVPLNADEILGIPGAFLEAGVRTVLVSISKAEGRSARALTTEYHRCRITGETPLRALRSAQRMLLSSGSPPGAWAGFSLYGYV
jgi:CHAT domain-containing protein